MIMPRAGGGGGGGVKDEEESSLWSRILHKKKTQEKVS